MIVILFWTAVFAVLHSYVLYPLFLIALDAVAQAAGAFRYLGGAERRRQPAQLGLPSVSVLVAAYNEAGCIAR
ncbi:MAG TPA: glycosyltransferase family 2 protein, partial [Myxococcales bacterium]|nr:glycosyltransferase family 2 protein [Myxococcales bacterium]